MIIIITGTIGAGKSAEAVSMIKFEDAYKGRMVWHHGINWTQGNDPGQRVYCESPACLICPDDPNRATGRLARDWYKFANKNDVFFYDECHHIYPTRGKDQKESESVLRLRESRKLGYDFIFCTQNPMFMDVNVRKLGAPHYHFFRHALGRKRVVFEEYSDDVKDYRNGTVEFAPLPKRAFGLYQSAEIHTGAKRRIPQKLKVLLAVIVGFGILGTYLIQDLFIGGRIALGGQIEEVVTNTEQALEQVQEPFIDRSTATNIQRDTVNQLNIDPMTYIKLLDSVPIIPGYPETAPIYSHLSSNLLPDSLPEIRACLINLDQIECKCYDQTGQKYETTFQRCKSFIDGNERLRTNHSLSSNINTTKQLLSNQP